MELLGPHRGVIRAGSDSEAGFWAIVRIEIARTGRRIGDGRPRPVRVLIVDNKDSFTFNLVQLVARLTGVQPVVLDNFDDRWRGLLRQRAVSAAIISPGPGTPLEAADFGICPRLIAEAEVPLLGICLGHQGIGCAHGARLIPAPAPMHGRVSRVTHDGGDLFRGIPASFAAVRYHSWCLDRDSLPAPLRVTAATSDGVAMAIEHSARPQFGIQFHPESIAAEYGERLVDNFLRLSGLGVPGLPARAAVSCAGGSPSPGHSRSCPARTVVRRLGRWVEPVDAFERLFAHAENAYWLDSATGSGPHARFSLMGAASADHGSVLLYRSLDRSVRSLRAGVWREHRATSLVEEIRKLLALRAVDRQPQPLPFHTGLVGFIGYEMRREFGSEALRTADGPDAAFIDSDRCLLFDHQDRQVLLVSRGTTGREETERWARDVKARLDDARRAPRLRHPGRGPVVASLRDGPETYASKVRECLRQLTLGESYQVCMTTEFSARCEASPWAVYRALRTLNPAPFAAYLRFGDFAVLSSSPERFLRVSADRVISASPIKGTCARGSEPREDARLARWLRTAEKFRSENLTIVDLLRNDIGRVAAPGSVHVPRLMEVESYATVHQLVSTIQGRLPRSRDCLDCLAAAFPGGSMTGAPKLRTMSIIDRLEERARGPYAGAIGYISHDGALDLSIAIRTVVMRGSHATVASGGGIVALSDPLEEFEEMLLKARAPLSALAAASTGDAGALELRYASP